MKANLLRAGAALAIVLAAVGMVRDSGQRSADGAAVASSGTAVAASAPSTFAAPTSDRSPRAPADRIEAATPRPEAATNPGGPPDEIPGKGKGPGKPTPPGDEEPTATDPAYSVPEEDLDSSLHCTDLSDDIGADRDAILLVHGTFTWGEEQFGWSWLPELDARGYDWCVVTYPDRGFGDMQVSAEYVAHAATTMHDLTGRAVDMAGHSQGGLMPRWALKYWPSVNAIVDDFVMLASPNHGTAVAGSGAPTFQMPEAFWQMQQGSAFVTTLNDGDESPGDVSYTSIYTATDELVQPSYGPDATAMLAQADNVTNLLIQDACPRVVDHLTIGTTDRAAFALTLAAFEQDGPLDIGALDLADLCKPAPDEAAPLYDGLGQVDDRTGLPVGATTVLAAGALPEPFQRFASLTAAFDLFLQEFERGGAWDWHAASAEPEIKPYAR